MPGWHGVPTGFQNALLGVRGACPSLLRHGLRVPAVNMLIITARMASQYLSYFSIRDCIFSSIESWFLTSAQFGTGRPFHFLYSSMMRR